MLNQLAKFLLVSTSLSPVLGAIAVSQYAYNSPWTQWVWWIIAALLLVLLCWLMLFYAARNAQKSLLKIREFERGDQEVVAFLLAYLLPFISAGDMPVFHHWMIAVYVLGIIFWSISHSGALHFNPVMGFIGYRFYRVRNGDGTVQLLISKSELRRVDIEVETVRLAQHVYLHIGGRDA